MDSTFVNILKDVTLQSIEFVKVNSPYLWEMTRQRVMIIATMGMVTGAIILFLSIAILPYVIHKVAKKEKDNEIYWFLLIPGFVSLIGIGVTLSNLVTLYSIDYVTMRTMILLIKP